LLVSPFIHLDAPHLGINLLLLWLAGTALERVVGTPRFLTLYLCAAWFSALMQWAVPTALQTGYDPSTAHAAIGSSGAVAGVLGALLVRLPVARLRVPGLAGTTIPVTPLVIAWGVYTLVLALLGTMTGLLVGVAHWAHLSGFLFGLGVAQLFGFHREARAEVLARAGSDAAAADNPLAASQAWTALLSFRPHDLDVRSALVAARVALGDGAGARQIARDGIETPTRAGERDIALRAYHDLSRLSRGVELSPGIRYRIGCWLAEVGDYEAAFAALLESVREDGPPHAAGAAAALHRAALVAAERLGNTARAQELWERLLLQFPDSPWAEDAREGLRRLPTPG
jgi:membrane associated rhomboid family serine protease